MNCPKKILFCSLLLLGCLEYSFCQENKDEFAGKIQPHYSGIIKTSPIALLAGQMLFLGEARFIYERVVTPAQSSFVGVSVNFPNFITRALFEEIRDSLDLDLKAWGFRAQGGYKFYLSHKNKEMEGFFIGPHISYNFSRVREKSYPDEWVKLVYLNGGCILGFQHIVENLSLEYMTGFGYRNNYILYNDTSSAHDEKEQLSIGFKFTLTFNMGYAF